MYRNDIKLSNRQKEIVNAINNGELTEHQLIEILESRGNATIMWSPKDVQDKGKEMGLNISDEDAKNITGIISYNHDANYGINWVTIETTIEHYFES